jgi:V/A-type H+-transporting ATPase subunit C
VPDFPYVNARVRAMRSRLLTPAQVDDLVGVPSLAGFLQALSATPYSPDLQEALMRHEGVRAVDAALARNLQRITRSILEFSDGPAQQLVRILLLRWDLANLRAIVRGKDAGRSAEEILDAVMPAGTLSEVALKEMAGYPSMTALAGALEALGHPFAAPLAEGIAEHAKTHDLLSVELRLDRAYTDYVLRQTKGRRGARVLREMLTAEVDAANIKTALKLASAGGMSEEQRLRFFIPGGRLATEKIFLALSSDRTQAPAWTHLRVQGFPIKELPRDLVAFERDLDLRLAQTMAARYIGGDPLGLDIIIGYLAMKSAEVANLRLIARGKFLGLADEAVRRELARV